MIIRATQHLGLHTQSIWPPCSAPWKQLFCAKRAWLQREGGCTFHQEGSVLSGQRMTTSGKILTGMHSCGLYLELFNTVAALQIIDTCQGAEHREPVPAAAAKWCRYAEHQGGTCQPCIL